MVYLIAGAPDVGKTTVAHKLAALYNARHIEIDKLMPGFNKQVPPHEWVAKLPVWEKRKTGDELRVEDYLTEQETYWPFIEELLNTLPPGEVVVEGAQLNPSYLSEWLKTNKATAFVIHEPDGAMPLNLKLGEYIAALARELGIPVHSRAEAETAIGL